MTSAAAIDIVPLADAPQHTDLCARWNYDAWGRDDGETLPEIVTALGTIAHSTTGEHALVALVGGIPAGMVLVIDCDLDSHAHLKPWVAGVYVAPAFRGRGVAAALVSAAEACIRRDGACEAFLYTGIPDLYARLGWVTREILAGERAGMALMAKRL